MQEITTIQSNPEIARQILETEKVCQKLLLLCEKFLVTAKVDEGHGISHILAVLKHVDSALLERIGPKLSDSEVLAIRCATILHDVDDHKFFDSSDTFSNASFLLNQIKDMSEMQPPYANFEEFERLVKTMVGLVSCSTNGNSNPLGCPDWMLYPRIADRLEAIGEIGITRALQYGEYRNRLMYDENTEKVTCIQDLNKLANKERFDRYMAGERSQTTIGHFYDKIVHIGDSSEFGVRNNYFNRVAAARKREVEEWLLQFWQNFSDVRH